MIGSKERGPKDRKEGRKEDAQESTTTRTCLVLELLFSAVGVVLQLVELLLAHAHDLAPLPPAKRAETLPFT